MGGLALQELKSLNAEGHICGTMERKMEVNQIADYHGFEFNLKILLRLSVQSTEADYTVTVFITSVNQL